MLDRLHVPAILCATAVLAAAGCVPESDADTVAADHAADRADLAGWRLEPEPVLSIGREDGAAPLRFNQIRRVATLPDGRIMVVNGGGPPGIRIFDPDGRPVASFGGQGQGPGEFASLFDAWPVGADTLLAWDQRLARATWFDATGDVVRDELLGRLMADGLVVRGRFADGGWLLAANVPTSEDRAQGRVNLRLLARASPDASVIDTIGGFEEATLVRQGTELELPALLPGVGTYSAIGDRMYATYGAVFEIDVRAADGMPLHVLRGPAAPPLTDALFERVTRARVESAPADRRPAIRRDLAERPRPDRLPALSGRITVDSDGHVWVQHFIVPDEDTTPWSVFDAQGRYLGDVAIPTAFRPLEITRDRMLGVWRDVLDVETVRAYVLEKQE